MLRHGDFLQHYQLIAPIGRGGFSEIYRATDTLLDVEVAIKVLLPLYAENDEMVYRFKLGAKTAARLNHPHIIRVFFMGEDPAQKLYYNVMELLPGGTLAERIEDHVWTLEETIPLMVKVADAVSFAHLNGFIHRDLKPENILYNAAQEPVITDFDLSRVVGQARVTRSDVTMGTLYYMSPEQIQGMDVTPEADVYSLGVMLFRLLTGKFPFQDTNPLNMVQMHLGSPVPRASSYNPALPPQLDSVIQKAMAKKIKDRYPSATALADQLIQVSKSTSPPRVQIESRQTEVVRVRPMLTLLTNPPRAVPLNSTQLRVGGGEDNDLVIQDSYISTHHGRFEFQEQGWVFIDQKSTNGTHLIRPDKTKQRLQPHTPFLLTFGDVLELGYTLVRFDPHCV